MLPPHTWSLVVVVPHDVEKYTAFMISPLYVGTIPDVDWTASMEFPVSGKLL